MIPIEEADHQRDAVRESIKPVTDPWDRHDVPRVSRISLDLLPKPRDVGLQQHRLFAVVGPPNRAQQSAVRDRFSAIFE